MNKIEYLESKNITKDFKNYEVWTEQQLFDHALYPGYDNNDGFFNPLFLFYDTIEWNERQKYLSKECFVDHDNDLYVVKYNDNVTL